MTPNSKDECPLLRGKTRKEQVQVCLNCPMARCIYTYEKVPHSQVCDMQLRELRQQGKTVKELAQLLSLSQRGVLESLKH